MILDLDESSKVAEPGAGGRERSLGLRVSRLLRELGTAMPGGRPLRDWGTMMAAILVALLVASVTPDARAADLSSFELGLEAVEDHRYGEALKHYQQAAQQGNRDAQRSLGLMLLYGERLYGKEVVRQEELAWRWLRAAASQGCEVSTLMLKLSTAPGRRKA